MIQFIAEIAGELLFWREDYKFAKRKKERRKFEKENNLPKKLMVNPVWMLVVAFIITALLFGFLFLPNSNTQNTIDKITKVELLLEEEKKTFGKYPDVLKTIVRKNPYRQNITKDCWNNEFYYKTSNNRLDFNL